MNPPEYDDILEKIDKLSEQWNGTDKNINLQLTLHNDEAAWFSKRIFEDVDRGLISATIGAKPSKYSIDLDVTLSILVIATAKKTISLLLEESRDYLNRRYRIKQRRSKHYSRNLQP